MRFDPAKVRAVLFDLDGVLVDSYEVWFRVMNAVARDVGVPPVPRQAFQDGWGQGIQADIERFYPALSVEELERRYAATYPDFLGHLKTAPGAVDVLVALREQGLPTALITNTPSPL